MFDPLDWLWPLAEAQLPIAATHITSSWPDGVLDRLRQLGLLIQADEADRVLCPECHDHFEEVLACVGPRRQTYFFIACPEHQRVRVSHEARRQWSANLPGLANSLAAALKLTGKVSEQSPTRVWRLGRTTWQGASRDVLLARGFHWNDAETIRGVITKARKPIVFVPQAKPLDEFWNGRVPPIIALDQVATCGESGIEIDALEITASIHDAEAAASGVGGLPVAADQFKLMIRRQLKAEHKTELTDVILLAAYRQEGSVRQAADFLTNETGKEVSKDQVFRAVQRCGGCVAAMKTENSNSAESPVASQPRDRKGKKMHQAKPTKEE